MGKISIRLTGTSSEIEDFLPTLEKDYFIVRKSGLYPNRNSDQFRMYVELERINSKEINDEYGEWSIIKDKSISNR